jgi:dihydrofolate reductase
VNGNYGHMSAQQKQRKLFWQMSVTLDGFMEGTHRELTDTAEFADKDFDRYASEMLKSIDTILLGRRTYELFAAYWPFATGQDAERLNELPKVVFSKTLSQAQWNNSRLVKNNVAEEVTRLKQQAGKDIALFGSADLASSFMRLGLIDEYRILVTPVVLGAGTPMFKDIKERLALKLMKATTWGSGIVALYYQPA